MADTKLQVRLLKFLSPYEIFIATDTYDRNLETIGRLLKSLCTHRNLRVGSDGPQTNTMYAIERQGVFYRCTVSDKNIKTITFADKFCYEALDDFTGLHILGKESFQFPSLMIDCAMDDILPMYDQDEFDDQVSREIEKKIKNCERFEIHVKRHLESEKHDFYTIHLRTEFGDLEEYLIANRLARRKI
ncbi:hypothetical protein ACOME3_005061 [Neoechinorhynchus agilis]